MVLNSYMVGGLEMPWHDILKLAQVTQNELALTLVEVILLKNGITDYTPVLLTDIRAEKSPPKPLPITEELIEELEEEDWV